MSYHGTFAFRTDIGKVRKDNEDKAQVAMNSNGEVLLIVCDGMGGASKGDLASKIAIESLVESFKNKKKYLLLGNEKRWFTKAAKKANAEIYEMSENDPTCKGMGTTVVAALISGERLITATVGDSRCYLLKKKNELVQLTHDQTYVNYLVSTGKISEEESLSHPDRHVLMNALGIYPSLSLTFTTHEYHGESILCCSDGLYNQIHHGELQNIMSTDDRTDQKVDALIMVANYNGGSDNIAVALWECIAND